MKDINFRENSEHNFDILKYKFIVASRCIVIFEAIIVYTAH